jgi:uncharacterized membrane protein YfcA
VYILSLASPFEECKAGKPEANRHRNCGTMDVSFFEICFISLMGILLGVIGAIIGSTLLVIVPMLNFFGLPIQAAIGTGKVSVIGRDIFPAFYFYRKKLVKLVLAIPFSISAVLTSWYGSAVAISLSPHILEKIVATFMILISAIIFINPKIGLQEKQIKPTTLHVVISVFAGALIGFYMGIFGGGGNVFIIFGFIIIYGNTFLKAAANSRIPNMLITAASIPMFVIHDFVNWEIAIPLTLSTAAGSYFGAKLAIAKGSKFIRALFLGLVCVMAIKYLI